MNKLSIFKDSIPKPLQVILIWLYTLLFFGSYGIYTSQISYMSGALGWRSDYFLFGNYFSTIGMSCSMMLFLRVLMRFTPYQIITTTLVIMALSDYIIFTSGHPYVIIICAFFIGFARMFSCILFVMLLMGLLSPDKDKGKFYSIFYPFVFALSQFSNFLMTQISYSMHWRMSYLFLCLACVAMLILGVFVFNKKRIFKKLPLYYVDFFGILLFVVIAGALAYIFAFGKNEYWYHSNKIIWATRIAILATIVLIIHQNKLKRPLISFALVKYASIRNAILLILFMGMYLGIASIQSVYTSSVLGYNVLTNARLNLMMIPGLALGGVIGNYWFKAKLPIKSYILLGFGLGLTYNIYLYFAMVPQYNFYRWAIPMTFRGLNMSILFISIWFYAFDKINTKNFLGFMGLMRTYRSFLATAFFSSLFSWLLYFLQFQSLGNMAVYIDSNAAAFSNTINDSLSSLQKDAVLVACKRLLGYTSIVGIFLFVYLYFHHFQDVEMKTFDIGKLGSESDQKPAR